MNIFHSQHLPLNEEMLIDSLNLSLQFPTVRGREYIPKLYQGGMDLGSFTEGLYYIFVMSDGIGPIRHYKTIIHFMGNHNVVSRDSLEFIESLYVSRWCSRKEYSVGVVNIDHSNLPTSRPSHINLYDVSRTRTFMKLKSSDAYYFHQILKSDKDLSYIICSDEPLLPGLYITKHDITMATSVSMVHYGKVSAALSIVPVVINRNLEHFEYHIDVNSVPDFIKTSTILARTPFKGPILHVQ